MKLVLRPFQDEAVDGLTSLLEVARFGFSRGKRQAVGLTATTGAGKTIIATALIERVLFGTDDCDTAPDPNAVFLWITDLPQINLQTRDKMLGASSLLGPDRLVVIENTFDQRELTPGRVYFLNTQKLGAKAGLGRGSSSTRNYPFWETVANTLEARGASFCLIVDEAHRGMSEGREREEANSIIQRFIKGTPEMPAVPLVLGISATPDRYNRVVEGSARTVSTHNVPPEEVRESGLIKERVAADVAGERQTDALALLAEAVSAWKDSTERWAAYCAAAEEETLVVPALIVQVENEVDGRVTQTDLGEVMRIITSVAGPLPDAAFAHSFGETAAITVGQRTIRYLEASRIHTDPDARVMFFKTGLGTGWDCPRAEVMFSFRRAVDATSIAQTIGRMVRTPLARRIAEDDRLNAVDVFLPHYNKAAVDAVVAYLHDSGDSAIAESIKDRSTLVNLTARPGSEAAVSAIEALPSYLVPAVRERKEVRRLTDMARSLSKHGIDQDAFSREMSDLAKLLLTKREALADDAAFKKAVNDQGQILIERVEWAVGEAIAATATTLTIPASETSIASLFAGAKRALGGDAAVAYWTARVKADASAANTGRLEAFALSQRADVMNEVNAYASKRIDALFAAHGHAIEALPQAKRDAYDRIRGAAPDPSVVSIELPDVMTIVKGAEAWPKHLYAEATGDTPLTLNTWETETMREELANPQVVTWLRNVPRERWALCARWRDGNAWHPFYPDFLVVRDVGDRFVVDILDPHDHTRSDAPKKAQGLADYARAHGHLFGHIDLIAKVGGSLRRLHLEDEKVRNAVGSADSPGALLTLYQQA